MYLLYTHALILWLLFPWYVSLPPSLHPSALSVSARFNGIYSSDTDDKGRHFIDRDGNRFRHILNYLRSGNCILGTDRRLCEELIEEAQYYGLQQLEENLLVRLSGLILEGHEKESELSSTSKATIDRRKEMAFDSPRCARSARKRNESPRAARVRRLDFEFSEDTTKNRVHDRIEPRRILPRAAPMWEFTTSEDF